MSINEIYVEIYVAFSTAGCQGKGLKGSPEGSIKTLIDRKKKRGVDGKKEYSSALQTFASLTL